MSTARINIVSDCIDSDDPTDFRVEVDFDVIPGEPAVRYYPDGSGYPGSDPFVDCVNSVRIVESDGPDGFLSREFWGSRAEQIESTLLDDLRSGAYDAKLLESARDDSYDDYNE